MLLAVFLTKRNMFLIYMTGMRKKQSASESFSTVIFRTLLFNKWLAPSNGMATIPVGDCISR